MNDENAYGVLIAWSSVDDDEYALEPPEFATRIATFDRALRACVAWLPGDAPARALHLGHAVYVEVADEEGAPDALDWVRRARTWFEEQGFETFGVVTHGARWVPEASPGASEPVGEVGAGAAGSPAGLAPVEGSFTSEPLRRALRAEAAAWIDPDTDEGWGPGLYLDADALEAMGKKLRNIPTELSASGATFFRFSR